jgi:phosphoglycolate phosphatase
LATICCNGAVFNSIEAVIFDKDGTLANSEQYLRTLAQRRAQLIDAQIPGVQEPLLLAFGLDSHCLQPTGLMAVGTRLENEIAAAAYIAETGCGWMEALEIARSAFAEADVSLSHKARYTPLLAGAEDLLHRLRAVGIKIGLLSSDTLENVETFVQHYQLSSLIQGYLGVHGPFLTKTSPGLIEHLLTVLEVSPQQTLMIGDALSDVQVARQARLAGCVAMLGGWSTTITLPQADGFILSLQEIQVSSMFSSMFS